MKQKGVSIVICCHNGARRLPKTIRHIARQRVPPHIPWEVVVVDNASSDGSAKIAVAEWERLGCPTQLLVVREPAIGLSRARATGFRHAAYEFVLLCDDDNWLGEHYVARAFNILVELPSVGALGGLGELKLEGPLPHEGLSFIFAAGPQACRSGRVAENRVYGAGCVVRHSAYERIMQSGFCSLLSDRKGAALTAGGDHELCYALAIAGYDIWYDESLRFTHFIPRERLTWEYFVRYARESSRCFNVLSSYKLIAANSRLNWPPYLVLARNFAACSKMFFAIALKRIRVGRSAVRTPLHFWYIAFTYKWLAYFLRFREMVDTHRIILNFRERCRPLHHNFRNVPAGESLSSFRLSFFSKPWRPLP